MSRKSRSIPTQIVSMLVLVATLILIVFGVSASAIYRQRELGKLKEQLAVEAEQLETAVTAALWHYDTAQLDKVMDGTMKHDFISGIIITSDNRVYARSRDAQWQPVAQEPAAGQTEDLVHEQTVAYSGETLGNVTLLATTKFLDEEIWKSVLVFGISILILDILLVLSMYGSFSKIVVDPLKKLEAYAVSISSGNYSGDFLDDFSFSGEMEVLRSSFENILMQLEHRYQELQTEAGRSAESEERFRILVHTIPDLIWVKNVKGIYVGCNKMFEQFFGVKEEEIVGKTDCDFMDKALADLFCRHDRENIEEDRQGSDEKWVTMSDTGEKTCLDIRNAPMHDGKGNLIGVLWVARDITLRKNAEEERMKLQDQLNQVKKIESVGRLAGGVAHDFNNMLSVISGHAELALEKISSSHPIHESVTEILGAAKRSSDLTRQLLAFARKQVISPEVLDLNETINSVLKMLGRLIGENINLAWKPYPGIWPVKMDPSQIDQILANLCVNASDAIDGVGNVTIETGNRTFDEDYCAGHPEVVQGEYVMLVVSDSGHGMDRETRNKIFEPFFTTKGKGKGTGLGLATVFGIVKQNRGFINVYSELGHGTVFRIYLPRYAGEKESSSAQSEPSWVLKGDETVLVVEDEPAILNMTQRMLENFGYRVLVASTPLEALRISEKHPGGIHLLITDVIMPGMNGRELAKQIGVWNPELCVLFMSGYTGETIAHRGILEEGINFIQKPFSKQDLSAKIREVLGAGSNADAIIS